LRGRFRQHDDHRQLPVGRQAVALEWPHRLFGGDYALAGHDPVQRRDDLGTARQDGVIGTRHCKRHGILSSVSGSISSSPPPRMSLRRTHAPP
jgi:hypothetical protein